MKFSFKKLALVILVSASIPILVSHANIILESIFLATTNLNTQYTAEIKNKLDTINKNKDDIDELTLEVKSKKNDLSMAASSIGNNSYKAIIENTNALKNDEKNIQELLTQFDSTRANIKKHKDTKDYSTLLNDMNNLISLQKNKYELLQKVDLDLDNALAVLK